MRPTEVEFVGGAADEFEDLKKIVKEEQGRGVSNSDSQKLLNSALRAVNLLKENPFFGIQIKKKQIPKKYDVNNLWKINLTGYWRMLYTVKGEALEILCLILEFCDHDKYNKIFGYK